MWGGAQGPGHPEAVGSCRGELHKVDPHDGCDLLGPQDGVYRVPYLGAGKGGHGTGAAPLWVVWVASKTKRFQVYFPDNSQFILSVIHMMEDFTLLQAYCECTRPSRVPGAVRVLSVLQC